MKKIGVVITTISNGDFLSKFESAVDHARDRLTILFYIVGDLNTPASCREKCMKIGQRGMQCRYLTVEDQVSFLNKIGFPLSHIPYRSDNRRNVGYLKAFEEGCDIIISMDDDNFPMEEDFFLHHSIVGDTVSAVPVSSGNRWVNPMSLLSCRSQSGHDILVYPRGFPYERRWLDTHQRTDGHLHSGRVGINAGLWAGDPDVDAVTRLTTLCQATPHAGWDKKCLYALKDGQLMPVNSQNTAIVRSAVFSYYFVKMGYRINGMVIDRFGDIFSGYFLQLCNRSVGNMLTFGDPMVFQARNEHDLLKDLSVELPGILVIEDLLPFLESLLPATGSYEDAYGHLIEDLRAFVCSGSRSKLWTPENLVFIKEITEIMHDWTEACKLLN
jgi:hypothetical protein